MVNEVVVVRFSCWRDLTDAVVCVTAGPTVSQGFGCLHHGSSGMMSCCLFLVGILLFIHSSFMTVTRNNMQSCCEEEGTKSKCSYMHLAALAHNKWEKAFVQAEMVTLS